jgi:hypothetical protein
MSMAKGFPHMAKICPSCGEEMDVTTEDKQEKWICYECVLTYPK